MLAQVRNTSSKPRRFDATQLSAPNQWHAGFLKLLPTIERFAHMHCRHLKGDARDEAVQDIIAHAACGYRSLADRGREDCAFASPLAGFGAALHRAGRRVGTSDNVRDVSSTRCQQRNDFRIERFSHSESKCDDWRDITVESRLATPAEVATTRLDFEAWLASLTKRNRGIAVRLAIGDSTQSVARRFKISPGRISQLRRELHAAWQVFQGEVAPCDA
jgi:hypothetical protein